MNNKSDSVRFSFGRYAAGWIVLFLCASAAESAPAIQSASAPDGLSQGSALVISGTGFGQKNRAAPGIFDTVERVWINGTATSPYSSLSNGSVIPAGNSSVPWGNNAYDLMRYATGGGYGNRSARYRGVLTGMDAWMETPRGWTSGNELYVRWYFKPSFDPSSQSGSHKFIRVWDTTGGSPNIRVSWTQMHLTYDGGGPSWTPWGGDRNKWNLMELYVNKSSRTIQAWVNGELRHDIGNFNAPSGSGGLIPRLWGLDGSGDANWANETVELSDYYGDTTRARVEICDRSSWAQCSGSTREPQLPTQWSSSQVRVVLNAGALGSLSNKYLYVIDGNGRANENGFSLSNLSGGGGGGGGSGGSQCAQCQPKAPVNLSVQ